MSDRFFIGMLPNTKGGITQFLIPIHKRGAWNAIFFGMKTGETMPYPDWAVPLEPPGTLTFCNPRFE